MSSNTLSAIVHNNDVEAFVVWCRRRYDILLTQETGERIVKYVLFAQMVADARSRGSALSKEPVESDLETLVRRKLYSASQFPLPTATEDETPEERVQYRHWVEAENHRAQLAAQ